MPLILLLIVICVLFGPVITATLFSIGVALIAFGEFFLVCILLPIAMPLALGSIIYDWWKARKKKNNQISE